MSIVEGPTAEASDMRRLDSDRYYGDRKTVLFFVSLGIDAAAMTARLQGPAHRCRDRRRNGGLDRPARLLPGFFAPDGDKRTPAAA